MAELTYPEVGQTLRRLPAGYRHIRRRMPIGAGAGHFALAADLLLSWEMHHRAGLRVDPAERTARPGSLVRLTWSAGPIRVAAPCQVVYVIEEQRRRGFAYGTLPGHPESGEEAFIVEHLPDGTVTLTITAFSRPATTLARLGGAVARAVQDHLTRRYLQALTAPIAGNPPPA
jgi:uncharacterized protein (UPF0548 family)